MRPEVKERRRQLSQKPRFKLVVDCFNKLEPATIEMLMERSGAGKGYVKSILNDLAKINLIQKIGEQYRINPENPMRYVMDGFYSERANEMRVKQSMLKEVVQ